MSFNKFNPSMEEKRLSSWSTTSIRGRSPVEFLGKARSKSAAAANVYSPETKTEDTTTNGPESVESNSSKEVNGHGRDESTPTTPQSPIKDSGSQSGDSPLNSPSLRRLKITNSDHSSNGYNSTDTSYMSSSDDESTLVVGSYVSTELEPEDSGDNEVDDDDDEKDVKEGEDIKDDGKQEDEEDPVEKKKRQAAIQRTHLSNEILSTEKKYTNSLSRIITVSATLLVYLSYVSLLLWYSYRSFCSL